MSHRLFELSIQHRVLKVVLDLPFTLRTERVLVRLALEVLHDVVLARVARFASRTAKLICQFLNVVGAA